MTANGWLQIGLYALVILAITRPVGLYMFRVFEGDRRPMARVLGPLERALYRLSGVDPEKEQTWGRYAAAMLLFSGVTMAVMNVSLRAQKDGTPVESILLAHLFTAIVGFPFVLKETWTLNSWLIIVYLGIFQIGLSFVFFTSAIKHVPAIEATLISTLEPILNPVWVFLFIGEQPGRFALLGGFIVLAGVAMNAIGGARAAQPAET